uniref:Aminotran_1_2 domain-containing protein n=1 Tax=Macrostomum lignano TaxID=282301 RepID=A0A1I8HFS2_9PLAT
QHGSVRDLHASDIEQRLQQQQQQPHSLGSLTICGPRGAAPSSVSAGGGGLSTFTMDKPRRDQQQPDSCGGSSTMRTPPRLTRNFVGYGGGGGVSEHLLNAGPYPTQQQQQQQQQHPLYQQRLCSESRLNNLCPRLASKWAFVDAKLSEVKDAGTWKNELMILGKQAPSIKVDGQAKEMLNFCANNYLGLSLLKQLLKQLKPTAMVTALCFDANAGIFEVLLNDADAVISDELNHASIIDGIRLSKARRLRYAHSDMGHLRRLLEESRDCTTRLVATDGVFSMDGDVAKLAEIAALAKEFNAVTFVDECHSTGFLGARGRAAPRSTAASSSTLGKALGGAAGGYTCGPTSVVSLLRQRSRPYLFSNTLPPAVVGAAIRVFDLLASGETDWPQRLRDNTRRFRGAMQEAGFQVRCGWVAGDPDCPICPVMLWQERLAKDFAERMQSAGMFVVAFSYPVVPRGKARIRCSSAPATRPNRSIELLASLSELAESSKWWPDLTLVIECLIRNYRF